MTACTDDERRRVVERLRMSDERDAAGFDCLLAEVVRGREFCETPCEHCHGRLLGELADLIDPGESGHNRDRNQDSVQKESPIVQIEHECDREALLALADELEQETGLVCGACMGKTARRIREACGKVA